MFVRKFGAIVAVSALVLLSVATGSIAAYAAPSPPTVDQTFADPWITDSSQPSVQGNMDLGVEQIDVEASNDNGASYFPYCTVTTNPDATVWFCPTPSGTLPLGANLIRAIATDAVPEASAPSTTPITITVVNPPTITSPADDLYTNDDQPTFSGTSEGTYFTVSTTDFVTEFCTGTVVNLTWNCTSGTIPDGDYTYLVQTTFGATSIYSASRTIHIDTVLNPLLTDITGPPGEPLPSGTLQSATTDETPTISGTAEPFATITMFQEYSEVGCAGGAPIADLYGDWSCTIAAPLPSPGMYVFGSQHTDLAGNTNVGSSPDPQLELTYTDTTPPAAPVVTSPYFVVTNNTTPTITGTGEPGASFDVTVNGEARTCQTGSRVVDTDGTWICTLDTPLADGGYDVEFTQTDTSANTSPPSMPSPYVLVDTVAPEAPDVWTPTGALVSGVIQATTTSAHPVITGMGEMNATVRIYRGGSIPVPCAESPLISGEGGFSCTVSPALSPGVHFFGFTQTDAAGNSSGSPAILLRLTVLAPPPPPAQLPTFGVSWLLQFQTDRENPTPGQNVTLTGSALPPGADVTGELHSTPMPLGKTIVQPDGTFTLNTVIPNTVEPGDHHYVVTVTPVGDAPQTVEMPVRVVAAPVKPIPAPTPQPEATLPIASGGSGGGSAISRDEPAAPNTLSNALPTVQDILSNPLVVGAAAASALALLFLVALPAELLNSTIDEHYRRIFGRIPRFRMTWLTRLRERLAKAPIIGGLTLTTFAALIFGFSDPHFGFDLASLRMLLAALISMFVLGYVANGITGGALKKFWRIPSVIELQPFGLVLALLGVVLSRLLDFAPGLLIGLVLCLALSASATEKDEVRYVMLWTGTVLGLSVIAWVGYSVMSGFVAPATFGGALVNDTLVAVATAGVSALVIGLLPVGYLDGRTLFLKSKLTWLFSYLVVLVAFFVIVVPSGTLWGGIQGPFWIWLTILLIFAAACVGTYLWFRFRRAEETEASATEHAVAADDRVLEPAGK